MDPILDVAVIEHDEEQKLEFIFCNNKIHINIIGNEDNILLYQTVIYPEVYGKRVKEIPIKLLPEFKSSIDSNYGKSFTRNSISSIIANLGFNIENNAVTAVINWIVDTATDYFNSSES